MDLAPRSSTARACCVALAAWSARSAAETPCRVDVSGAAHAEWRSAARELESELAADCDRMELVVERGLARLRFVTRDGRIAERELTEPDELLPTVLALGVTLPSEPVPGAQPAAKEARPSATARSRVDPPADRSAAAEAASDSGALFALQGGTRAGSGYLLSPVVGAAAALALDHWELGVTALLDIQYFDLQAAARAPSSAVVVGVLVGRREPLAGMSVLVGGRLMVAAINDESEVDTGERGGAEVRLGADLGLVFPSRAATRARLNVVADIVPHDIGGTKREGRLIKPWWALSTLIGVEFGGT